MAEKMFAYSVKNWLQTLISSKFGISFLIFQLGKKCFNGFKKLNIIQSLVFTQAYKSQENLLICAPTGAGMIIFVRIREQI